MKFTVSKYKSCFWFFKYIEISYDKYAKIDIDTIAADIKQYFQIIMILAYFVGMKGVSTPPTFSAVPPLPPPPPVPQHATHI